MQDKIKKVEELKNTLNALRPFTEDELKRLDEKAMLNIHSLALMDWPEAKGKYRNVPVKILETNAQTSEPYLIKPNMENLINWYKEEKNLSLIEK